LIDQVSTQTVFARLLHAHRTLMRSVEARLRAEHGLSANDFEALLRLSRDEHGAMRRIDLAERLRLTPSGVTRLLDGLEEAGLTGRRDCPADARVTYSVITETGREMLRQSSCTHAAVCDELIGSHLSPAELEELSGLLGRLPGGDDFDPGACTGATQATG
jgi:DNA-binding MarR family transcriptional regulator